MNARALIERLAFVIEIHGDLPVWLGGDYCSFHEVEEVSSGFNYVTNEKLIILNESFI